MNEVIKKHQHLLELTKTAFQGNLEPIGLELLGKLEQFSSFSNEMFRGTSIKDGFLNTYGEKEWCIEIKAKKGRARYIFEEQQVVLKMLLAIENVIAKVPDVSTEKKLQRQLFKIALPFYYKCVAIEQDYKIGTFENYLIDFIEEQYRITLSPRSFEKWNSRVKKMMN